MSTEELADNGVISNFLKWFPNMALLMELYEWHNLAKNLF
jgi:hypothetical protein